MREDMIWTQKEISYRIPSMFDIEKEQGHFSVYIVNSTWGWDTCTVNEHQEMYVYITVLLTNPGGE